MAATEIEKTVVDKSNEVHESPNSLISKKSEEVQKAPNLPNLKRINHFTQSKNEESAKIVVKSNKIIISFEPIFTFKGGDDKNAEYKCNLCSKKGFLTTTNYGLKQHLEKKHSKADQKNFYESLKKVVSLEPIFTFKEDWQFGKVVYQCNLCPERCSLNSLTTSSLHLGPDHVISTGHQMTTLLSNFEYYFLLLCLLSMAEF